MGNEVKKSSRFKDNFLPKLNKFMGKVGQQRHLAAIRDSFATMIPLIIAGSMGMLIDAIIFGGGGSGYISVLGLIAKAAHPSYSNAEISALLGNTATAWGKSSSVLALAFGTMNTVTIGMISIYFSFLFGYYIALSRNFQNPIITGMVSVASLVLGSLGNISFVQSASGLIAAIILTIISAELFIKLSSVRALLIKLPNGVPPAVGRSFAVFLPVMITMACISVIDIAVFAPAMATHSLYVSTGANFTGTYSNDDIVKALSNISEDTKKSITDSSWFDQGLWDKLVAVTTGDQLNTLINGLSDKDQHIVASYFAIIEGNAHIGDNANSILSPTTTSTITSTLVNGNVVLSYNIQIIQIDYTGFGIAQAIFQFFTSWFIGLATGKGAIGIAILYVMLVSLFWIFGIHGTNILMGIFSPIFLMVLAINTELVSTAGSYEAAKNTGQMGIFATPFFDSYVFVGGAGSTLTLLIATLIFSKRNELKEIAKYATPAGCFQINEPVMFGYPIVLNGMYAFPFIFTQLVNVIVAWFFVKTGVVKMQTIQTPWTAPWFIGGVISSVDGKAVIPAFINFGLDLLLYVPFVLIDNLVYFGKLKKSNPEQYEIEMRIFRDPEYRYNFITDKKVSTLEDKGDQSIMDAMESVKFWEKRMTDKNKLEIRKKTIMDKANSKKTLLLEKSETIKANRDSKVPRLKSKWNSYMEKQELKKQKKIARKSN